MSQIPANTLREREELKVKKTLQPGEKEHYRIWQDVTSPYSQKVIAFLNYKAIPYKRLQATLDTYTNEIPRLVGQTIIPVVITPDEKVMQDSTPIMEWLENTHKASSTIPRDKGLAFVMWLLEDFADEYLPRLCMHTRWGNRQNKKTLSHRIARGMSLGSSTKNIDALAKIIEARQSEFDKHLGLTESNVRASLDEQIMHLYSILEAHLEHYQFLIGFKPSMADFAFFGFLKAHLFNDPDSNATMEINAPRTCRWIETIADFGDSRGCAGQATFGEWIDTKDPIPKTLVELLQFVAGTYIPLGKSNAQASKEKLKRFQVEIFGVTAQISTHQYRSWAFEQIQKKYLSLEGNNKIWVDEILELSQVLPDLITDDIVHCDLYDGFNPPFIQDGICDARVRHLKSKKV